MNRIEKLKKFLQKFYPNYQAFNTRNLASNAMVTVYTEDGIQVDEAFEWGYIEIFGLTEEEFKSLLDPTSFLGQHLKTFDEYVEKEEIN